MQSERTLKKILSCLTFLFFAFLYLPLNPLKGTFLGIGKMDADGFRINSEGKISDLTKEELYDFI